MRCRSQPQKPCSSSDLPEPLDTVQVAPAAGVVISIFLFCSPIPGAIQARKDNSIGVRNHSLLCHLLAVLS